VSRLCHAPRRDLADRFVGNRDYFRQPDWIRRTKHWLALVALGLSVGWLVFDRIAPSRAAYTHTHGPLADPHAAFDANCEACHRGYTGSDFGVRSLFHTRDRWRDLTCEKCHAGPPHHQNVAPQPDGTYVHANCSNCHHDHAGRANSLVRIPDQHCTRCHAELPKFTTGSSLADPPYEKAVTNFAKDHPEFRVLARTGADKPYPDRRLKFSHALHMTMGLAYHQDNLKPEVAREKPEAVWTLARLTEMNKDNPERAARYKQWTEPGGLIKLDCASCHQLDAELPGDPNRPAAADPLDALRKSLGTDPPSAVLRPRAGGAYYRPVNFELHCRACHPLKAPDSATTDGSIKLAAFDLPHRAQPDELRKLLAGRYAERLTAGGHKATKLPLGALQERIDKPRDEAATEFAREVDRLTERTMGLLFVGATPAGRPAPPPAADQFRTAEASLSGYACGKCHYTTTTPAKETRIAPIPNKTVWFAHAKFNHVSHRGVRCADCHPGTESSFRAGGATEVVEAEPVRIAGIDSCKQCHAPAGTTVTAGGKSFAGGGSRHDCTLCHRYHNNDHPLQGRGATARDPQQLLSVQDFLGGKKD